MRPLAQRDDGRVAVERLDLKGGLPGVLFDPDVRGLHDEMLQESLGRAERDGDVLSAVVGRDAFERQVFGLDLRSEAAQDLDLGDPSLMDLREAVEELDPGRLRDLPCLHGDLLTRLYSHQLRIAARFAPVPCEGAHYDPRGMKTSRLRIASVAWIVALAPAAAVAV